MIATCQSDIVETTAALNTLFYILRVFTDYMKSFELYYIPPGAEDAFKSNLGIEFIEKLS